MRKNRKRIHQPPGSVIFTGSRKVEKINIHYLEFDEVHFSEERLDNQGLTAFHEYNKYVQWYDTRGLHDTELIEEIGRIFKVHPLALEDIADIHQRPKFDEYAQGNFVVLKALQFDREQEKVKTEQVALFFGGDFVLSFQETETDLFEKIRYRLHKSNGRIRTRKADYLAYALLDTIVDNYYLVLDSLEERIDRLEEEIINDAKGGTKARIHHLKQEMLVIKKSIAPLREAISRMTKAENDLIAENTQIFLRDLHDHTIQVIEMAETYRDMLNGLQDLYLSEISFKMNQVMQILTIMTTIFVPLSFLAGIYGMNFENMPELHHPYGYFTLLSVMFIIAVGFVTWFKWKKWL